MVGEGYTYLLGKNVSKYLTCYLREWPASVRNFELGRKPDNVNRWEQFCKTEFFEKFITEEEFSTH